MSEVRLLVTREKSCLIVFLLLRVTARRRISGLDGRLASYEGTYIAGFVNGTQGRYNLVQRGVDWRWTGLSRLFDYPLDAHGISGSFGSRRKGSSTCAGHSLLSSLGRCGPLSILPGPGISIFGCHFSRSLSPSFDEDAWSLSSELDAGETPRRSSGEALLMKANVRTHRHEVADRLPLDCAVGRR